MNCGVGRRHGLYLALLWHGPAAVAPTGPLAWGPLYAVSAALKSKKKNKNKQTNKQTKNPDDLKLCLQ